MSSEKITFYIRAEIESNDDTGILEMSAFIPYSSCKGEGVKYLKHLVAYPARWEVEEIKKEINVNMELG